MQIIFCCMRAEFSLEIRKEGNPVFSTGICKSNQSVDVTGEGFTPVPGAVYEWSVTVRDNQGEQASGTACFQSAPVFLQGKWIEPSNKGLLPEKQISIIASQLFHAKPKLPPQKRLMPQTGEGVVVTDELPVKEIIHTPKGETVLDFGQTLPDMFVCAYTKLREP